MENNFLRMKNTENFHIDQMMGTENFRVRNDVVERGSVPKESKRKESLRREENGRVFSVENTRKMFQRRLM